MTAQQQLQEMNRSAVIEHRGDIMERYSTIIDPPSYTIKFHPCMSILGRAAQFAPFAALSGFDEDISETARLTEPREDFSEDELDDLDKSFQKLIGLWRERPKVTIRYFQPDKHKDGGKYLSYSGTFRFYDEENKLLMFTDDMKIPAIDVADILFE